jgi:hypothetical protein
MFPIGHAAMSDEEDLSDVLISSTLSKAVSRVWVCGTGKGADLGEGVSRVACEKRGSQFSTWD